MDRAGLIDAIVESEWRMLQEVQNEGGRASCQDDRRTFGIMRSSQAASWPDEALDSYLDDLSKAEESGRNLLSEKYARMMRSTRPAEYARIEHLLSPVPAAAADAIESIVSIVLGWESDLLDKYPNILKRGRPLFSGEDSPGVTSLETYLRGELATYSVKTLELLLAHYQRQQSDGGNGSAITLLETMKQYGFGSLEEANEMLAR